MGILASHILLTQRWDHKEMQDIHFDQDVQVYGIYYDVPNSIYFWYSFDHDSLSFLLIP